jgi:sterol desaturase/sphingolipid hydroxylase (fatty acid hydroxylase superfamily)
VAKAQRPPEPRPKLDLWLEQLLGDGDPGQVGSGWLSGTVSVFLGLLALGGALVLRLPGWLSTERFRSLYPIGAIRTLIEVLLVLAFALGIASGVLRRRKVLGVAGAGLAALAALLGGGGATFDGPLERPVTFGLDWFLLNLFLLALLFVPLERAFAQRPLQGPFRPGWTTDLVHFGLSHVFVQVLSFLILLPATSLAGLWRPSGLQALVGHQPVWLQVLECVLVADLAQYSVHRAFHRVPWLWRFHAVHHSSEALDWLAGSRLHLVDVLATRSLVLVPLFLFGFAQRALEAYLVFVSFHAVFIHANLRFGLRLVEPFLVTPRFHHWHHSAAAEARDRNFAVHLPWIDVVFGSRYLPERAWPEECGIMGRPVPPGWLGQTAYPFRSA